MSRTKRFILPRLYFLKLALAKAKLKIGIRLGLVRSLMIMPYKGFGNENEIHFVVRVIRDRGIGISQLEDSSWRNFKKMYKRFMTWQIPGARVKATFHGMEQVSETDEEGYAEFHLPITASFVPNGLWHEVQLSLLDQIIPKQGEVRAENRILMPSGNVEYGIISDIDDTIVPTGATRIWEMLKTTFFGNAHSRVPFPGVSAFYQALAKGNDGIESNPFFYISSSPWNLYDFLMEFLNVHDIPRGPLMLRDLGLSREQFIAGSHSEHKLLQVEKIFEIERHLQFILIGDSGQHDPEIYLQVIQDYPGRVKVVYIRDVDPGRHAALEKIKAEVRALGVDMMLVTDTTEAARDAISRDLIVDSDLFKIEKSKTLDEKKEI
ncbi:App1 family protein [Rhodonellum sp.]|uniref:App1 family protein n=1 Tax=Rhodonellum sp. TaxID=2231180 RepID=UPI0027185481|nr:phosphatase domain-containing protein [Rhodonellum sp.]MDO9552281.1 DUF2183 domain-containing protein [Rhodonellum sp.]